MEISTCFGMEYDFWEVRILPKNSFNVCSSFSKEVPHISNHLILQRASCKSTAMCPLADASIIHALCNKLIYFA